MDMKKEFYDLISAAITEKATTIPYPIKEVTAQFHEALAIFDSEINQFIKPPKNVAEWQALYCLNPKPLPEKNFFRKLRNKYGINKNTDKTDK